VTEIIITRVYAESSHDQIQFVFIVEVIERVLASREVIRYDKVYEGCDGDAAFMAADAAQKREFGLGS
jgi:hypothetical protein